MDMLILNTIEVSDVPEVAQVSKEDYEGSIERLDEWSQVMQEPENWTFDIDCSLSSATRMRRALLNK